MLKVHVSGPPGSGKTAFVNWLREQLAEIDVYLQGTDGPDKIIEVSRETMNSPFPFSIVEISTRQAYDDGAKSPDEIFAIYSNFVKGLTKPHGTDEQNFLHGAVGVMKEGGELLDNAYRYWNYGKAKSECVENLAEEAGDILFYLQMQLNQVGLTLSDAILHNIDKLKKRYPEGYSNAAALARADKAPGE